MPEPSQNIYREAFNHAYAAHAGALDRDETAHMIAWAAVKRCLLEEEEVRIRAKRR